MAADTMHAQAEALADARRERDDLRHQRDAYEDALIDLAHIARGVYGPTPDDEPKPDTVGGRAYAAVCELVRERDALRAQLAETKAALLNDRGEGAGPTPDWHYAVDPDADCEWQLWHVPAGRHPHDGNVYSVAFVWDEDEPRPAWILCRNGARFPIAPNGSSMVKHAREGMWLITRHLQENP